MGKKAERFTYGEFHEIGIVRREGIDLKNGNPFGYYHANIKDISFPMKFNNISFHDNGITIFTMTGNAYAGIGKILKFDIIKYPNGVINGEITAKEDTNE
jgi:hypothetical protein